jgi:hypothetical protein
MQHPLQLLLRVHDIQRSLWGKDIHEFEDQLLTLLGRGLDPAGQLASTSSCEHLLLADIATAAATASRECQPFGDGGHSSGSWGDQPAGSITAVLAESLGRAHSACTQACKGSGQGSMTGAQLMALAGPLLGSNPAVDPSVADLFSLIEAMRAAPNVDMRGADGQTANRCVLPLADMDILGSRPLWSLVCLLTMS